MTEEGVARLIAPGDVTTEFKRSMPSNNLGTEICAFANATGGVTLLGVTDEGKGGRRRRPQPAEVAGPSRGRRTGRLRGVGVAGRLAGRERA